MLTEVRLSALAFLSPHDIDALQLVDRALCTFIETHRRRHLSRHTLQLVCGTNFEPTLRFHNSLRISLRRLHTPNNASFVTSIGDKRGIALRLDSNRVCRVSRLEIRGDMPQGGESMLADQLLAEGIPLTAVAIHGAQQPASVLRLASRLRASCIDYGCDEPLFHFLLATTYLNDLYHTIPCIIYHADLSTVQYNFPRFLSTHPVYAGRAVFTFCIQWGVLDETAVVIYCVRRVIESWIIADGGAFPRDLLLIYSHPFKADYGPASPLPRWVSELGEPEASAVRMDEWYNRVVEGDTPLHDYYRLLEGCEWAVWRVRSPEISGKHLQVMQRMSGGDKSVFIAVHLQVVVDK